MKPGDPFDTKERDRWREHQRGDLRILPDWIIKELAADLPELVPESKLLIGL